MSTPETPETPHVSHHSIAYNLVMIALAAAFAAVGLAYVINGLSHARPAGIHDTAITPQLTKTIAGQSLTPPVAWIRFADQMEDGFAERLDIALPVTIGPEHSPAQVDATLLSATRARASALLLDTVYLLRFAPEQMPNHVGLVGKPLAGADGYAGEIVWYDPLSINPFVAKCTQPVAKATQSQCVRTIVLPNGLAIVLTFGDNLLPYWRELDQALAIPLKTVGVELTS